MHLQLRRLSWIGIAVGFAVICTGAFRPVERKTTTPVPSRYLDSGEIHKPIELISVGDRVLTGAASDLNANTSVEPTTWKKIVIDANWTWPDGTQDVFKIETLKGPEWLREYSATVGCYVPLPLDLLEMGCPDDLLGKIISIDDCPEIQSCAGHVVLTTVNHLNPHCRELVVRDSTGEIDRIRTTDLHRFWSISKDNWVQAFKLKQGNLLQGQYGEPISLVSNQRIEGVHTVFNLTVEHEHVYRVGTVNALVHNTGCVDGKPIVTEIDIIRRDAPKTGGRKGNATTRAQNQSIADRAEAAGQGTHTAGADLPERYYPNPAGGRKGGRYSDVEITRPDGTREVINTVDTRTYWDGATLDEIGLPTERELDAALDIYERLNPGDTLILVPK
ncbi:MAG: polymorphic toxin-type HINT domain-containing protein [Planctomycetota bacterium]